MSKAYRGIRHPAGGVEVIVFDQQRPARVRPLRHIVYHSPTGFEWAYGGSGPADLALAILADHLGEGRMTTAQLRRGVASRAWDLHQPFKREVISGLDRNGWSLTTEDINRWIAGSASQASLAGQIAGDGP